jgi:hypothetical protein
MYVLKRPDLINNAEKKVFQDNIFPQGLRKFNIEGNIMLGKIEEKTVFFNSKFESGNLR